MRIENVTLTGARLRGATQFMRRAIEFGLIENKLPLLLSDTKSTPTQMQKLWNYCLSKQCEDFYFLERWLNGEELIPHYSKFKKGIKNIN